MAKHQQFAFEILSTTNRTKLIQILNKYILDDETPDVDKVSMKKYKLQLEKQIKDGKVYY